MKTLLLVRGLPGSGKSTFAHTLAEDVHNWQYTEADYFFMDKSEYNFDPAKLKAAHEWCLKDTEDLLTEGAANVVVSNTFSKFWEVEPYALLSKRLNVNLQIIELNGGYKSIHNVPDEKIQAMRDRWESLESILEKCRKA